MGVFTRTRVLVAAVTTLSLTMAGLVVLTAGPALAAPHFATPPSVQLGWSDSARPRRGVDAGEANLPLGSHLDEKGRRHTSRVYATFDLGQFTSTRVISARVFMREIQVTDCSKRAIEVWSTKSVGSTPSWDEAPRELVKQDELLTPEFCPRDGLNFDVTQAVVAALADDRKRRVTLEIRVPAQFETDPSYGRYLYWFRGVSLTVEYNTTPSIDGVRNGGFPCATDPAAAPRLSGFAHRLEALGSDPDENERGKVNYTFVVWPQDNPAAATEVSTSFGDTGRYNTVTLANGVLVDGHDYAWRVRITDGVDTSAWSATCYFHYDATRPTSPTVTSSNYPESQFAPIGEPGVFTFSAAGDPDVVAYEYGWEAIGVGGICQFGPLGELICAPISSRPGVVVLDTPGDSATVTVSPPRAFFNTLVVRTVDAAGNRSIANGQYPTLVPDTSPTVTFASEPQWNQPVTMTFGPHTGVQQVIEYEYTVNSGEPQTLPAEADGTATVTFVAESESGYRIDVRSRSVNGWVSSPGSGDITFYPWPGVTSDVYRQVEAPTGGVGIPGTFTFSPPPGWLEVGGYSYLLPGGSEYLTVPAGPDGRASITWTPEVSGFAEISVFAIRPDGTWGDYSNNYWFEVA